MSLRADDGTLLEAKEPVVILGPESGETLGANAQSPSQSTDPFGSAQSTQGFRTVRFKTLNLRNSGPWLAPLAILVIALFLIFGTLFLGVFVGMTILVAVVKKLFGFFQV